MLNSSRPQVPFGLIGGLAAVLLAVASSSCGRGADRAANDTGDTRDSLRADTSATTPVFREWIAEAGRYLLVATESPDTALVVFPEFTFDSSLANVDFASGTDALSDYELFARDGVTTVVRLTGLTQPSRPGCEPWPRAVIQPGSGLPAWTIGLRAARARGIAHAALDRLPERDSAGLVISLTRLASQAPNDTMVAFRGLPYVVRSAYRATLADSQTFVFGELLRRVNIEASPHEERTTVIGEKAASGDAQYVLGFSERHTGDEESVPTTELIGLVVLRDGTHVAFGARDYSDGGTYLMFVRSKGPRWRLRWQSAYAGC